jgi:hypothetical protein
LPKSRVGAKIVGSKREMLPGGGAEIVGASGFEARPLGDGAPARPL